MATRKKRTSSGGAKPKAKSAGGGGQRTSAATRRKRQKARETHAIKSMALGGLIVAVLCVVFFVRFGGKTLFNHVFEPDTASEPAKPKPVKPATGPAPTKPRAIKLNPAAPKAPAMDKVTPNEQKSLDDLINSKAK